ncbi:hypothetical protein [Chrysiogenes arsenatis]|uniref:hypothetical protein n=1 Tax=Chrysiogenes arsenatis TaxID=309797 RepID=UPI00040A93E5|nr:hypothetical protein [Chrysiogenes arsenatis]
MIRLRKFVVDGAKEQIDYTFRKSYFYTLLGDRDSGRNEIYRAMTGIDAVGGENSC